MDLMNPRYKMIASYFGAKSEVFDILHRYWPAGWKSPMYVTNPDNPIAGVSLRHYEVEPYDHLFKRLEWYEDRQESEMPEYVKLNNFHGSLEVHKVAKWNYRNGMPYVDGFGVLIVREMLPATEAEYLAYKEQQKGGAG